jgi:hypothetical protein
MGYSGGTLRWHCVCARVRVRANGGCTGTRGTAATGGIYSSAVMGGRTRVRFVLAIGRPPICYAGVTWTSRTTSAQWAARYGHTTVIAGAGAIYVIGGADGVNFFGDAWMSTDGGADRTRGG